MTTTKRLNQLYRAMLPEAKGPATLAYIVALKGMVDELRMEVDILRLQQAQVISGERGRQS